MLSILRAMLIVVVVQLSGVPHLVADAFASDDACCCDEGACRDCDDGKSGADCPPGCATCQCAHGGIASLPNPVAGALVPIGDDAFGTLLFDHPAASVPKPDLPGLFRPPRSLALPT